jgi:hypothetical protein
MVDCGRAGLEVRIEHLMGSFLPGGMKVAMNQQE